MKRVKYIIIKNLTVSPYLDHIQIQTIESHTYAYRLQIGRKIDLF
jgi:hypothetical protein